MAYEKQRFEDNKPLCAAQLEHIEEGILENALEIKEKAVVDDNSVGSDTWSSKHIVEKLCPIISERGSFVRCIPLAGYPMTVTTEFMAIQQGIGDPAPDNICEISAPSVLGLGLWTGKNLFKYETEKIESGYVMPNGTLANSGNYYRTKPIPVSYLRGNVITVSPRAGGQNPGVAFFDEMDKPIPNTGGKGLALVVPHNACFMRFSINKDVVADTVDGGTVLKDNADVQIQVEIGSEETLFEPFIEQNFMSIHMPEGVAGGIYDWNTGLLTVTHRMVDMGNFDWCFSEENYTWRSRTPLDNCKIETESDLLDVVLCNVYTPKTAELYEDNTICFDIRRVNGTYFEYFLDVVDNRYVEVEDFVQYLNDVGAMLVYPLEVPYTVQYDPQKVIALEGTNNFAGGSGNTKVVGRHDPAVLINSLMSRVAALETAAVNNT